MPRGSPRAPVRAGSTASGPAAELVCRLGVGPAGAVGRGAPQTGVRRSRWPVRRRKSRPPCGCCSCVASSGWPSGPSALTTRAQQHQSVVDVGDDQMAVGSEHPGELGENRIRGRRRGSATRPVTTRSTDASVNGTLCRSPVTKSVLGQPAAGMLQHLPGAVHADDAMSALDQPSSQPTRSAGRIKGVTDRQRIDDLVEHGLVQVEQPVRTGRSWTDHCR